MSHCNSKNSDDLLKAATEEGTADRKQTREAAPVKIAPSKKNSTDDADAAIERKRIEMVKRLPLQDLARMFELMLDQLCNSPAERIIWGKAVAAFFDVSLHLIHSAFDSREWENRRSETESLLMKLAEDSRMLHAPTAEEEEMCAERKEEVAELKKEVAELTKEIAEQMMEMAGLEKKCAEKDRCIEKCSSK